MSLSKKMSSILTSYKKNGRGMLDLVLDVLDHSAANSNATNYVQRIMDTMEGNDIADMHLIFTTYGPFSIKEGVVKVTKGTKDKPARFSHRDEIHAGMLAQVSSFRTLAASLRGPKTEKAEFDLDKWIERMAKTIAKEHLNADDVAARISKAAQKILAADAKVNA